jgi:hypothetical protein
LVLAGYSDEYRLDGNQMNEDEEFIKSEIESWNDFSEILRSIDRGLFDQMLIEKERFAVQNRKPLDVFGISGAENDKNLIDNHDRAD